MCITRRSFVATIAALGAAGLHPFEAFARQPTATAGSPPPDVLIISVDDLNDWVGFLGGYAGKVHTPNIDRLAQRGMAFTKAVCPAPMCNPSRAAFWTGQRPSTSGVYGQHQPWETGRAAPKSLIQSFADAGYDTAGAGKIYHHANWVGPDPGFAEYVPFRYGPHPEPDEKRRAGPMRYGKVYESVEKMPDYQTASFIGDRLLRQQREPKFLAAGIFRPHEPFWTPDEFFDLYPLEEIRLPPVYQNDLDDVPPWGKRLADPENTFDAVLGGGDTWRTWKELVRAYLASISFVDAQVGQLLDALDRSPRKRQTIVVLWSDHGLHFGEKQHFMKAALWYRAIHIPLIIHAPGVTQPESMDDRPADSIDVYPTMLDLCGISPSARHDGNTLRPRLEGRDGPVKPALTMLQKGNVSILEDRFHLIAYQDETAELYDLVNDPHEWDSLATEPEHVPVVERLMQHYPMTIAEEAPHYEGYAGYQAPSIEQINSSRLKEMTPL